MQEVKYYEGMAALIMIKWENKACKYNHNNLTNYAQLGESTKPVKL